MSTKEATSLARSARKSAVDTPYYDLARKLERAIEELSKEIDSLKGGKPLATSTKEATSLARSARKSAVDTPYYDLARKLERAIEELSKEIDFLKGGKPLATSAKPKPWALP